MLDLPYATHRSLIQPLTDTAHVKLVLIKRFLGFIQKIRNSEKKALNMLMLEAMKDVRSVTGSNMRNIMLLLGKSKVEDVQYHDHASLSYFKLKDDENWKVAMIKEIVEIKFGDREVHGFNLDEVTAMLDQLCTD